jgi:hypothetical protein
VSRYLDQIPTIAARSLLPSNSFYNPLLDQTG